MKKLLFLILISIVLVSETLAQNNSYISLSNGSLVKFNNSTCDTTFIGNPWGLTFTDIAITPSGRLYGTDYSDLFEIDTSDASVTFIANLFPPTYGINNLVALNDEYLLGISGACELYRIRTSDGAKFLIAHNCELGCPSGDITFYKGYFYSSHCNNALVRFKLNDDFTEMIEIETVGNMNTSYGEVWGVLTVGTANCKVDNLKILAFEGWTVYEVNPDNAFCTIICDSTFDSAVTGAASQSETSTQIISSTVIMPNVFTPNNDGSNDFFSTQYNEGVKDCKISILNRWGNLMFEDSKIDFKWDGNSFNNNPCNEGVYFYIIEYSDHCGNEGTQHGTVSLIR